MRSSAGLGLVILALSAVSAFAAFQSQKLVLNPSSSSEGQELISFHAKADGAIIELNLPYIDIEAIVVGNDFYQKLSIPGGIIQGEEGQAGLPTFSKLIVIPEGATVSARLIDKDVVSFSGFKVYPIQPRGSKTFVIDQSYDDWGTTDNGLFFQVGEAAQFHRQRVLPITFSPVAFNAASGELYVAQRIEVEIEFDIVETHSTILLPSMIPESFNRLFQDVLLGYQRSAGAVIGPGTYLMIYPESAALLSILQPLVNWRQRQGYNVVIASDAVTGTSSTQIKDYIQSVYDSIEPPLEFVCLIGDATLPLMIDTFTETVTGYNGEGDHYYTNLDGNDPLSDVHIGRLSISTAAELANIVGKIIVYETNPPTNDSGWFSRASLAGDPSESGITTIFVNQWVKNQLLAHNYTQIDTMWLPNAILMRDSINQGMTAFGYRGFYEMSGLSTGYISALTNGYKLPFALIPTCATGSFKSLSKCHSEAFLRAANGGGIGAVGTATGGTHTRHNNCYYAGTWDAAINGSDHRLGVAHTSGKLALFANYYAAEPNSAEGFMVWNNLMGDPATDMWTSYPASFEVLHSATMPVGANAVAISVSSDGNPVEAARVALFKEGEIRSTGYTDDAGSAVLPISDHSAGSLLITVVAHNFIPYQGNLALGQVSASASYEDSNVDDDGIGESSGNGNGIVNPDEIIEMPVALHNYGTSMVPGVTATISATDNYVTVTDAYESFGDIDADSTVWSAQDFNFSVAANTPDGHVIALNLLASSVGEQWISLIELEVQSAAFAQESFDWGGDGNTLDPGESGPIRFTIRNIGSIAGEGISAVLESQSAWITITNPNSSFGNIDVGATGDNAGDPYDLVISPACFQGHLATFILTFNFNGSSVAKAEFSLPVGSTSPSDPIGPDGYGYYAFDSTDNSYPHAPVYNWVEIDPNYGGNGADLNLTDFGWEEDDTKTVELPFSFTYYGQAFDKISICSNGWVSLGETSLVPYRNWSLPCAGSAAGTIAPYWDNLYQSGTNKVYTLFDSTNNRYIIQWSRMLNDFSDSTENFELILLDPAHHPTTTGDGEIIFQYEEIANTDSRDGYGTVGIENISRSDGLLYTYWDEYAPGAAPLASGLAIRFIPLPQGLLGFLEGNVSNSSNGGTPIEGVGIRIVENGQELVSGPDGFYANVVNVGNYTVRAEHESFDSVEVSGVTITKDETTELNFQLIDILGPYIVNTTLLSDTDDTIGPYVADVYITDFTDISEMHFYYRLNWNALYELSLSLIDAEIGQYRVEIPGVPLDTFVEYWVEAEDLAGNSSRDPVIVDDYYEFAVVASLTVIDDDFESDLGWFRGVCCDPWDCCEDQAYGGLWERGDPHGTYLNGVEVQPEDDASGDGIQCWITGNEDSDEINADNVLYGKTLLISPFLDLSGARSATVSYQRWYTNDLGPDANTDYWTVEVNNTPEVNENWVILERTNVTDRSWSLHSFDLSDYIELTNTVRFRFIADDAQPVAAIVEAGLDEFKVTAYENLTATPGPDASLPAQMTMLQNAPNPFNPSTRIQFGLPDKEVVSLKVYGISGRLVRNLVNDEQLSAGFHERTWDGRNNDGREMSSGIYFYRLSTANQRLTKKMTLLK